MKNNFRMSFFVSVVFFSFCYGLSSFALSVPNPTLGALFQHLAKKLSQNKSHAKASSQKTPLAEASSCELNSGSKPEPEHSHSTCTTVSQK